MFDTHVNIWLVSMFDGIIRSLPEPSVPFIQFKVCVLTVDILDVARYTYTEVFCGFITLSYSK